MAITKTDFINFTRCSRYINLEDIRQNKLTCNVTLAEYLQAEEDEHIKEILSSIFEIAENEEEIDKTNVMNPQLMAMMKYYKQVELVAADKVKKYFGGSVSASLNTQSQECFECTINGIKYLCYVDIYNKVDELINIIEVKATTTKKYLELGGRLKGQDKYSIFTKIDNIYYLKDEVDYSIESEMKLDCYKKQKARLLDRYSNVGKYVFDLAIQRFIIEHDNNVSKDLHNIKYYLAFLNHEYTFNGNLNKGLYDIDDDGNEIVSFFDFTEVTKEYQPFIDGLVKKLEGYLKNGENKEIDLGCYCERKKQTQCKYFSPVCGRKIPSKNSVFNYMNSVGFKDDNGIMHSNLELVNLGYLNLMDIPESWIKSSNHLIQRNAITFNKEYINKAKIKVLLDTIKYPIYHLDFETFPCPLPRFKGEKCYTQSPFEFSLHIENEPGICDKQKDNYVFLAKTFDDERKELVKMLVDLIKPGGTLLAQNVSFETNVIKKLSVNYPEYKKELLAMLENRFDLIWLLKTNTKLYEELGFEEEEAKEVNYYHPNLSGSYSIKKTLPVFSDLSYHDLDVQNGTEAIVAYANYDNMTPDEYTKTYQDLINYCQQDTWAMVVILEEIRKLVKKM